MDRVLAQGLLAAPDSCNKAAPAHRSRPRICWRSWGNPRWSTTRWFAMGYTALRLFWRGGRAPRPKRGDETAGRDGGGEAQARRGTQVTPNLQLEACRATSDSVPADVQWTVQYSTVVPESCSQTRLTRFPSPTPASHPAPIPKLSRANHVCPALALIRLTRSPARREGSESPPGGFAPSSRIGSIGPLLSGTGSTVSRDPDRGTRSTR
jgi:hypothetical protein